MVDARTELPLSDLLRDLLLALERDRVNMVALLCHLKSGVLHVADVDHGSLRQSLLEYGSARRMMPGSRKEASTTCQIVGTKKRKVIGYNRLETSCRMYTPGT
jgi:hypothetical protein